MRVLNISVRAACVVPIYRIVAGSRRRAVYNRVKCDNSMGQQLWGYVRVCFLLLMLLLLVRWCVVVPNAYYSTL